MNPYGKRGGIEHQKKITEIADKIELRGFRAIFERLFRTPEGKKRRRFADIVAVDGEMNIVEIHQVGKKNKNGSPIKRERNAIADIESSEDANKVKVQFHSYSKIIILALLILALYLIQNN